MTQTVAAELQSVFTAKGVAALLGDYQKVDRATNQTQTLLTAFGKTTQRVWQTGATDASRLTTALGGVRSDLSRLNTEFTNVGKSGDRAVRLVLGSVKDLNTRLDTTHTSKNRFFTTLTTQAGTAQRDIKGMIGQVETLGSKLAGLRLPSFGGFSLPGFGGGGGGILGGGLSSGFGIPGLGLITAPLGAAAGLVGNVAGGALSLGGQAAGFGLGQLGAGLTSVAGLDAKRALLNAVMGGTTKQNQDYLLSQAFKFGAAPELGTVDTGQALDAMIEAAKAGIGAPQDIASTARTGLLMRAAGGEKIDTGAAVKLLLSSKNAFSRFHYSDKQIANMLTGAVNASVLDQNQIQSLISGGGAAASASGMGLDKFLLWGSLEAQAGISPGQIGGGIRQAIRMSDPNSSTSKQAMAALGLITTETHTVGATPDTPATKGGQMYLNGQKIGYVPGTPAKKGSKGKQVTTVTGNDLFDAQGEIVDPATFFARLNKGTAGMNDQQIAKLIGQAFNPKAAAYIQPLLNMYKDNPQVFAQMSKAMTTQGDVEKTQALATDNLQTSWTSFGNALGAVRDKILMGLTPALKTVVNWGALVGTDVLDALDTGNWTKLGDDFFGFFNRFDGAGTKMRAFWDQNVGPTVTKVLDAGKQLVNDALTGNWSQIGADFQADLNSIFGTGTSSAVQANLAKLSNFFDSDVKPIFFGTDDERAKAIGDLLSGIGGALGGWLSGGQGGGGGLPKLLGDAAPAVGQMAAKLGAALGDGFMQGVKGTGLGRFLGDLQKQDWNAALNELHADQGVSIDVGSGKKTLEPTAAQKVRNALGAPPTTTGNPDDANPRHAVPAPIQGVAGVTTGVSVTERALGGPAYRGQPLLVGERRPELFVPPTNGTILPRLPGGGGTTFGPFQIIIQVPAGMASDPQGWHQTGILVGRGITETLDKVAAIRNAQS